jgi:predicted TIM-barrel fold metal-dependent hydrolase
MDKMRFFDVNCMIGSWLTPPLPNTNLEDLARNMEYTGIDKAVVYHSDSVKNSIAGGNEKISKIVSGSSKFEAAWIVLPGSTFETPDENTLIQQMRFHRIHFLRLFPKLHNYDFADWQLRDLFAGIDELKIPIILECSQVTLDKVYAVLILYPNMPVIITNTSYWPNRGLYELGRKCPNVYFEISSFMHYNGLEDFASKYGVSRLVFGTNMPFQEPGPAVFRVLYSDFDTAGKQAIASGNLEEIISGIKL